MSRTKHFDALVESEEVTAIGELAKVAQQLRPSIDCRTAYALALAFVQATLDGDGSVEFSRVSIGKSGLRPIEIAAVRESRRNELQSEHGVQVCEACGHAIPASGKSIYTYDGCWLHTQCFDGEVVEIRYRPEDVKISIDGREVTGFASGELTQVGTPFLSTLEGDDGDA